MPILLIKQFFPCNLLVNGRKTQHFHIIHGPQHPNKNVRAYSQLGYLKGWSNEKRITKDYFGFLLHLLFYDYNGLVYDYN
jgi:hypothetical protein